MRSSLMFLLVAALVALSASLPMDAAVTEAPINVESQLERPELEHNSVEELTAGTGAGESASASAADDEGTVVSDNDGAEDKPEDTSNASCEPAMCSRIYQPVCVSIDGVPLSSPNLCHSVSKVDCAKKMSRSLGEKDPIVLLLHKGPCRGDELSVVNIQRRKRGPRRF